MRDTDTPAFPVTGTVEEYPSFDGHGNKRMRYQPISGHHPGMTLRDWYAGMAIQAAYRMHMDGTRNVERDSRSLAVEAFAIADAMIERSTLSREGKGE